MIKSFKKGLALVLAAAMVFSTPIAVNTTKADAATVPNTSVITGTAWWDGPNENSGTYSVNVGETVDLYVTHVSGSKGLVFEANSDGNYFDCNLQGALDVWGDLQTAKNVEKADGYELPENAKISVTRTEGNQLSFTVVDRDAEDTTPVATVTATLTLADDAAFDFYLMATDGSFRVSPYDYAVVTEKKSITGTGWWDGPNENSDTYYVEPNGSVDIYAANTAGNTGVVLEAAASTGYIDLNMQTAESMIAPWGDAITSNTLTSTAGFPEKGIVKISLARTGADLKITITDAATDEVITEGTMTLNCPETELLGFYVMTTDGSFDVGPTLGSVASLISDLKAAVSKDGTKIQLTAQKDRDFDDIYVNVNDEKDELNDVNVASNGAISYEYAPEESGDYKFDMVAEKAGFAKDDESASLGVVVEDGKIVLDAELASDFAVVKGGASYGFTAKKLFDDVTYTIEVSESGKVVATLKEGETLDFSKLTSGKEYTAKLIAKKDGYATKTYTAEKFKYEAAAKATTPTNFANITTQPVVKYTFDNADGLTLNGDAKVVDGVLNLANTTTQHNNSWAKIADITKYDFSKGMTITSDVKVTSWVGDWSKIILLGNIKGFKKFSEMAEGDVAYGITEGFMSCIDVDKGIKTGYYGGGQAVTAGTAKEGAAPLGTTAMPLVYNWYADTTKQNRWDTITVTITPTEMITYYDGVKVQSYKDDYTVILNAMKKASENYLGTSYFSDDFDFAGALDNVGIYDTALSADEVSKLSEAKADNTAAKPTEQGSQQATAAKNKSLFFTDWSAAYGKKKVTGELNTSGATVTVKVGKKAAVKATVKGKTFTAKVAKLTKGTKVVITAKKDGYSTATKTITVKAPMKVKSVKAKKGTKKVTGTISVKGATVKVKVGKKAYKKAKVKGKKFTLKVAKLKKGTKVKVQATKKNYKTATKTVKVK